MKHIDTKSYLTEFSEKNISIISVIFLPKMQNLNLNVWKYQTNLNWETFYNVGANGASCWQLLSNGSESKR